jgi:hypothetical protein
MFSKIIKIASYRSFIGRLGPSRSYHSTKGRLGDFLFFKQQRLEVAADPEVQP